MMKKSSNAYQEADEAQKKLMELTMASVSGFDASITKGPAPGFSHIPTKQEVEKQNEILKDKKEEEKNS